MNHLTTWFATFQSIFCFLKIVNFSHCFFTWLKWRMNRVPLALFLASFFLLSFDLFMQDALGELWMNTFREPERNMTLHLGASKIFYLKSLILLSLTYVIPFILFMASLLPFFLFLVRHIKNFQVNLNHREISAQRPIKGPWKWWQHFSSSSSFTLFLLQLEIGSSLSYTGMRSWCSSWWFQLSFGQATHLL